VNIINSNTNFSIIIINYGYSELNNKILIFKNLKKKYSQKIKNKKKKKKKKKKKIKKKKN